MNQPIRMYHIPASESPRSRLKTPATIRKEAKKVPAWLAIRVARALPRDHQRAPRKRRPPSIGKAGTRLNTARIRLMSARYLATDAAAAPTKACVDHA